MFYFHFVTVSQSRSMSLPMSMSYGFSIFYFIRVSLIQSCWECLCVQKQPIAQKNQIMLLVITDTQIESKQHSPPIMIMNIPNGKSYTTTLYILQSSSGASTFKLGQKRVYIVKILLKEICQYQFVINNVYLKIVKLLNLLAGIQSALKGWSMIPNNQIDTFKQNKYINCIVFWENSRHKNKRGKEYNLQTKLEIVRNLGVF